MKNKLFISNLDFSIDQEQLENIFNEVGNFTSIVIAVDKESRRSRGFAFVEMKDDESADKAVEVLNNREINGRPMKVSYDRGKNQDSSKAGEKTPQQRPEQLPPIQRMQLFKKRKKLDPFIEDPTLTVDYRDVILLSKFVSEKGKILSRKLTGLTAHNQRKVAKAIKRSQNLGLMAFNK